MLKSSTILLSGLLLAQTLSAPCFANQNDHSLCAILEYKITKNEKKVWKTYGNLNLWISVENTQNDGPGRIKEKSNPKIYAYFWKLKDEDPNTSNVDVSQMPDANPHLYMGTTVSGSADCQDNSYALQSINGTYKSIPPPPGDSSPCWTVTGNLGKVLGSPAYIESGLVTDTSDDVFVRVWPWVNQSWRDPCKLTIRFDYSLKVTHQFCGDAKICASAAAIAVDVAQRFIAYEDKWPHSGSDDAATPPFRYQIKGTIPSLIQTRKYFKFPLFGYKGDANSEWDYSIGEDFQTFPLKLLGRNLVGVIGHNGYGWRSGDSILFAVYALDSSDYAKLTPIASFSVNQFSTGIKTMKVVTGKAAIPRSL